MTTQELRELDLWIAENLFNWTPTYAIQKGDLYYRAGEHGYTSICAVKHEPWQAHNQQSLFYQYKFYGENGRWPTWKDAIEHCTPEVKAHWVEQLAKMGVKL